MDITLAHDRLFHDLRQAGRDVCTTERSSRHLDFGPLSLTLRIAGNEIEKDLMRALSHAESDRPGAVDIEVTDFTGRDCPLLSDLAERLPDHLPQVPLKFTSIDNSADIFAAWQPHARCIELLDPSLTSGLIAMQQRERVPSAEWASPLRNILHWLSGPTDAVLVHGAGLWHQGTGVLLAGWGGAGKSTTTARAVAAGFQSSGDDVVMVSTQGKTPRAHALFDAIKVSPELAPTLPVTAQNCWHDVETHTLKKLCRITDLAPERLRKSFDLAAILLPVITGNRASRITPGSSMNAMRALGSTLAFMRGHEKQTIAKLGSICQNLPAYRLELGSDPDQLIDILKAFCEKAGK